MGPQGVRQDLQRRMELGGPSRREGKVSTALTSRSESSSRGAVGSACRGGRILEPGRQIRAVEIRAGSIARAWTLASVPSSEFIRSPRLPQSGAPGPWDFGAPSMEDGRPWAPRRGAGEEPGVGLGARSPLSGQTRGRGRKASPRPGLAPAGIPVSDGPQWLPRRPRLVAAVPTLSETTETPHLPAPTPRRDRRS